MLLSALGFLVVNSSPGTFCAVFLAIIYGILRERPKPCGIVLPLVMGVGFPQPSSSAMQKILCLIW